MLDLSNNDASGHDFKVAYKLAGQRRLYLKLVEGTGFVDRTYVELRDQALAAGFHVGAYDFLHPLETSPAAAASYFLEHLGHDLDPRHDLRPCLDVEHGTPSTDMGKWVAQVANELVHATGVHPVIYGSGYFLEDCHFTYTPGPLWLAAYGRNDGREYPVQLVPKPWTHASAHQFTSVAHVAGIHGACDLSHVTAGADFRVPTRKAA